MLRETKNEMFHYFKDEQERYQGKYIYKKDSNSYSRICHYRDDMLNGEFFDYYADDKPRTHCFYLNNQRHGEYKKWDESGNLTQHSIYLNGHIDSGSLTFNKIPLPPLSPTEEDYMYYLLKYGIRIILPKS